MWFFPNIPIKPEELLTIQHQNFPQRTDILFVFHMVSNRQKQWYKTCKGNIISLPDEWWGVWNSGTARATKCDLLAGPFLQFCGLRSAWNPSVPRAWRCEHLSVPLKPPWAAVSACGHTLYTRVLVKAIITVLMEPPPKKTKQGNYKPCNKKELLIYVSDNNTGS